MRRAIERYCLELRALVYDTTNFQTFVYSGNERNTIATFGALQGRPPRPARRRACAVRRARRQLRVGHKPPLRIPHRLSSGIAHHAVPDQRFKRGACDRPAHGNNSRSTALQTPAVRRSRRRPSAVVSSVLEWLSVDGGEQILEADGAHSGVGAPVPHQRFPYDLIRSRSSPMSNPVPTIGVSLIRIVTKPRHVLVTR